MALNEITPALLKKTFQAWQQSVSWPTEWLHCYLLIEAGVNSEVEQSFWLHDFITKQVTKSLNDYRRDNSQLTSSDEPTRKAILDRLEKDFSQDNPTLEAWSAIYHRFLSPLELTLEEIIETVPMVERSFNRRLNNGLKLLARLLQKAEYSAQARLNKVHLSRHLPSGEYLHLYGTVAHQQQLIDWLKDDAGPTLIIIKGIGGIGKTALAQSVAHRMAEEPYWTDICWISARQEWVNDVGVLKQTINPVRSLADVISRLTRQLGLENLSGLTTEAKLTALRPILQGSAHLIIIDNLETLADSKTLLPAITPLAGRTRFILTSRQALPYHNQIQIFSVPPLSLHDSQALLENELARQGRTIKLTEEELETIYTVIGGLPLALKLAAAQMAHTSFQQVLVNLKKAVQQEPAQMYRYIYQHTWDRLTDSARILLLSMLRISPDGEGSGWLQMISGLSKIEFQQAIKQLNDYSLLEIRGSLSEPLYFLHRLTITFLQTDIIPFSSGEDEEE